MNSSRNSNSASTLVVGDIHGCFDELVSLIELAGLGERDNIVAVGDLIDRGPKSREVVKFFVADPARRRSIRGNHEHKHLQNRGQPIPSKAGRIVRLQTTESQYGSMLSYFETMPVWIELPEALIVHAGLEPGIPLDHQEPKTLMGVGSGGRDGFDGKSPWWFDRQELIQSKPIVFGHEKHEEGVVRGKRNNVFGIDTGAALGGPLTGLLLPEFRLISVPVRDYWSQQLKEWLPRLKAEDIYTMPWEELLVVDLTDSMWSPETHEEVLAAKYAYQWLIQDIEERREALLSGTGYLKLEGPQKGELQRRWRNATHSELNRWVIESLPARDIHSIVRMKLPDWGSLRTRLGNLHEESKLPIPE